MHYDFDREINRIGTNSLKWEFRRGRGGPLRREPTDMFSGPDRVLPLWVADMDFVSPEPVVSALRERAAHGIFGYSVPTDAYYDSVVRWMKRRHGWEIQPEWIVTTPGVIPALYMLVQTFTSPGDRVLVQPPVYFPFFSAVTTNGREVARNPLSLASGRYSMDVQDLEHKLSDRSAKMAILCSPHNPVGRVWSRDELRLFGEACLKHDVLVVSDEIHADLVFRGNVFTPFAAVSPEFSDRSVICTAPSKTFNLPGLHTSAIIIPNPELRSRFQATLERSGLLEPGLFGMVALQAAYDHGEEWLEQVLDYLEANLRYLEGFLEEHLPRIKVVRPEATFLVWLDCRDLGLDGPALSHLMLDQARVYLEDGFLYGPEGEGFLRLNIACPRSILAQALERIKTAVGKP